MATLKALQHTVNTHAEVKTATVYTDSRMTLDSLKNTNIHTTLVEEIRQQLTEMKKMQWYIEFCWVKAHVGIQGNETVDTLAKEAATSGINSYLHRFKISDTPLCPAELRIKRQTAYCLGVNF